jgi:predicted 2-oxoglutarate/Fe(II)-dependent dioxygenase YbiX
MYLDIKQSLIVVVDDILSPEECASMIARIEEHGPSVAPITTYRGPVMNTNIRNNERVMFDDPDYAAMLFERIRPHAPDTIHDEWSLCGANERLRCYKYSPGQFFAPHGDGAFARHEDERSFYTYLIYLNGDCEGGETRFCTEPEKSIQPHPGRALLFQHPIPHEGAEVISGRKYVVRTDLMYRRVAED